MKLLKRKFFANSRGGIRKVFFGIMFLALIISIFGSFPCVQIVALGVSSRDTVDGDACLATSICKEGSSGAKVIEHKITESELNDLKREMGVFQNNVTYNKIFNGHGTGLRPPSESEWIRIAEEALMVDEILSASASIGASSYVDHTTSLWFPPIGDQDIEGSCTTWALVYYMKTFQEAQEHGWDLSGAIWEGGYPSLAYQDRIFTPDFAYHQINNGKIDGGSSIADATELVCSIGACTWAKMPYDPNDSVTWPSEEAWREAPLYRGNSTEAEYINLGSTNGIENLKNWIASDNLAVILVDADSYENLTSDDLWTLDNYVETELNHANTIVGYDDNLTYTEQEVTCQGAFKIANSWGVGGWENVDDGCYWISYEAMKQIVSYAFFYHDRIAYEPKVVASFKIDHAKRNDCGITLGIGDKSASILTKELEIWDSRGGALPFCSNNIIVDITEFEDSVPTVIGQQFFLEVFELGDFYTTGTILDFSIEYYEDYSSHVPNIIALSDDPPVDTVTNDYVYAEVTLLSSVSIEYPSSGQYVNDTVSVTGSASQYRRQEVYAEDFNHEGNMPSGWALYSAGPDAHNWTIELRTNCRKDYWAECNSYKAGHGTDITEWLYMTEGFNAIGYSSLDLEFYSYYWAYDGDEYAQILYTTSQSYPNFTILETWTLPAYSDGEQHHHINLTAAAGDPDVRLAFVYHGTWDWYVQIDNIVVYGLKTLDEVAVRIDDGDWNITTGTTSWTHNWNTNAYPDGNHAITARAQYGTAYAETSINVVVCNNLIHIDQFFASDNRCNVGSMQTVGCHAMYAKNGSSVTEGTIWLNGTGYSVNSTGWCTFDVTSSIIGKNTWTVTNVSCNGAQYYEVTASSPYIIFDKINLILTVNDTRIDVGSEASVNWTGVYAYDGAAFLGSIALNDTLTKNQVGIYKFTCASVSDSQYGITAFDSNEVYCIWDRIKISNGGVTHSSTNITQEETVWFTIEYEYDESVPFSGEVYINNTLAAYSTLNDRWEYNYTLFSPGTITFSVSKIVDNLYGLTNANDAVGPLPITWHHFQILYKGETYVIPMTTNSHVSNLQFNASLKQIMFTVSGETGTMGYCNITIPKTLLKAEPLADWKTFLDGYQQLPYIATENDTHTFIYINYTYSNHEIQIQGNWAIPEFSPATILLLLMLSTMFIIAFRSYAKKPCPKC
jgi:hypothetical protein